MARKIPSDLIELIAIEADAQDAIIERLKGLTPHEVSRRPEAETWSPLEHIEHLNMTNLAYLGAIEACVAEARSAGLTQGPPWKLRWMGGVFLKSLAPPVKRRLPTFGSITPQRHLDRDSVFATFAQTQVDLRRLAEAARGLDLQRAMLRSPLLPLMKFQLGAAFMVIQTHNRRHFWNIDSQREKYAGK